MEDMCVNCGQEPIFYPQSRRCMNCVCEQCGDETVAYPKAHLCADCGICADCGEPIEEGPAVYLDVMLYKAHLALERAMKVAGKNTKQRERLQYAYDTVGTAASTSMTCQPVHPDCLGVPAEYLPVPA
jgi:hypothetical protein